jgi:predicted outer membrane repeat protein
LTHTYPEVGMTGSVIRRAAVICALLGISLAGTGRASAQEVFRTVGDGTSASCTDAALDTALSGGPTFKVFINFACGAVPKAIAILSTKSIGKNVTIDGDNLITLDGGLGRPIFAIGEPGNLSLKSIVLARGANTLGSGGAIRNLGTLSLDTVTVRNSIAPANCGGGVFNTGALSVRNSVFADNLGSEGGGALCMFAPATATISINNTLFERNIATAAASGFGGAVYVGGAARVDMVDNVLTQNTGRVGGAIYIDATSVLRFRSANAASISASPARVSGNNALENGGGIYNAGHLDVYYALILSNKVPSETVALGYGGGVGSAGVLTLSHTLLSQNEGRFGGGLFVGGENGSAIVSRALFSRNVAAQLGGGLYTNNISATLSISDSSFLSNNAATGGALARTNTAMRVDNSAFNNNSATLRGGGLWIGSLPAVGDASLVPMRNVTISNNRTTSGTAGGVFNTGRVELYSATIISNTQGVHSTGGAISRLRSAVVWNDGFLNCDGDGTVPSNDGFNHVTDSSCGPTITAKPNPQLAGLAFADNETLFALPLVGSPLIDAGPFNCEARDQRGATRIGTCDIGAAEFGGKTVRAILPQLMK